MRIHPVMPFHTPTVWEPRPHHSYSIGGLMKGRRFVIPESKKAKLLEIAHKRHTGVSESVKQKHSVYSGIGLSAATGSLTHTGV